MNEPIPKDDLRKSKMMELSTHLSTLLGVTGVTSAVLGKSAPGLNLLENLGISLVLGVGALFGLAFWLAFAHRDNVYHLVARDKGGGVLFDHVRDAKQSIICTHFTKEQPSKPYLAILKQVLESGVTMRRLINFQGDPCATEYDWLKEFEGKATYEQIAIQSGLPFNVVIVDQQIVWIFFPLRNAPYFRNAIWFRDSDVAELFDVMLAHWQQNHHIVGHARNCQLAEAAAI